MTLPPQNSLTQRQVLHAWTPLAASWLLMSLEMPAVGAALLRLPQPELHMAAFGGIAFPLAMIIEAPIINLLSASTTLCRDWVSYQKAWRFMMVLGGLLTLLHALLTFTPLYDLVVFKIIGAPLQTYDLIRPALAIMLPWTWAIGYRRFHQGILIRFQESKAVSIGTLTRLITNIAVLTFGLLSGVLPGVILGAFAITAGVLTEALYIGYRCHSIKSGALRDAPVVRPKLTSRGFLSFYTPLALTSILFLLVQPMGSAALSRLPLSLNSLACWPIVTGLLFFFRSPGIALTEVVVAHIEAPNGARVLLQFTLKLIAVLTLLLAITALTPLGELYCRSFAGLSPELARYAASALVIGIPLPALNAINSWHLGQLLHARRTRHFRGLSGNEAVLHFLGPATAREPRDRGEAVSQISGLNSKRSRTT